jgi:hypothetical protein
MIYGFSLLLLLLSLVFGIPALRKMMYMRKIKKNGRTTTGNVISTKSAIGWLWVSSFGNQDRPLISYQSPNGHELTLEVTTSSVLPTRSYQPNETVEVMYDVIRPGRAYAVHEWSAAHNDLLLSGAALITAMALWIVGRIYNLPF